MGVGMGIKSRNPDIQIVEAHPILGHYIQGLKNMQEAIVPEIYDPTQIDRNIMIKSDTSFAMARTIVSQEGIFVGMSSGAAMLATLECIKDIEKGFVVVVFGRPGRKILKYGFI